MNDKTFTTSWPGLIEAYTKWLPVTEKTPVITLQEGRTPLLPIKSIADRIGKEGSIFSMPKFRTMRTNTPEMTP